ncbi:hypothetical protein ACFORO_17295 [Amycolatopsis halotolerans]|uniref:HTH crp-type domain-containing protein n=1 Tax=Amycolatopsis halotolerans TaxID=330083 RepID=A0ABV7QJA0_9PSEU
MAETHPPGQSLVDQAVSSLRTLLGESWTVTELPKAAAQATVAFDATLQIDPPGHGPFTELVVTVKQSLTPRAVERAIGPIRNVLAHTRNPPTMLVVAPWISPRTQAELRDRGIGYLDLTGNVSLAVDYPAIRILTHGASHAPRGLVQNSSKTVTLAGPRSGRVVRFLADYSPPYQATEIAEEAQVSLPWVSQILGQLEDQLLIERHGRSILEVNWEGILRARAETYDLLRHNPYVGAIAPFGIPAALEKLRALVAEAAGDTDVAVTGPYAARAIAPLTEGGQLMLYVPAGPHNVDEWIDRLELLRADEGADVLLLRAHDKVVFRGTRAISGIPHVAQTQLVLDGLSGPGRMPAEAEAVLRHMRQNPESWRPPWRDRTGH